MSALLAFEAAVRHGSATDAAAELSLTQSAVSRQIRVLEDQIGIPLFRREGRRLVPTPEGRDYAARIRDILGQLGAATLAAGATKGGGSLTLAILPAFGMHWLAPRLPRFAAAHPEVTLNLATRLAPFDFRSAPFDAAIHFGRRDWPGAVAYLPLMPERVLPVCAPALMQDRAPRSCEDLRAMPLLHLDSRPRGWARWFAAQGNPGDPLPSATFDQFSTMAQAAIHGLGVALLPDFVAAPHLETGQLVLASEAAGESIGTYFLVWPEERSDLAPLGALRQWLASETAQTGSMTRLSPST